MIDINTVSFLFGESEKLLIISKNNLRNVAIDFSESTVTSESQKPMSCNSAVRLRLSSGKLKG